MTTAWDCFHFATLELVRSSPIKQRLISAYRRHLATLTEDELPFELRSSFAQISRSLRGVQPLRGEDAVAASVRKMSNQEADECAALIVELFGLLGRGRPELSMGTSGTVVQLHKVEPTASVKDFDIPALIASN
jgi:hypothetical protein